MQSFVSVPVRLARKELKQRQKTVVWSRYLRWTPFKLTRFCSPSAISSNQSCSPLRERLTQCSLRECSPPPSLTSVHHEKCKQSRCVTARMSDTRWSQTKQPDARSPSWPQHDMSTYDSQPSSCKTLNNWQRQQPILPTLKARGWSLSRWELDVRSEISVFIPKWHSLCIFPIAILCCTKCWDASTMRQHPRNLSCRCQTAWFEVNWKNRCESSILTPISDFQ